MRSAISLLVLGLTAILSAGQSLAAVSQVTKSRDDTHTVWFSGKESRGLRQDSAGSLIVLRGKLPLEKPVARLYAAAYYPSVGTLVTIDENAVTQLYEQSGSLIRLKQTRPPHRMKGAYGKRGPIHPIRVRFCNVPGLVYLTWSYPEPSVPIQVATQYSERIALGPRASNWHAVTTDDSDVKFLPYTYRIASRRSVHLFMPDGKRIIVRLPGELAEPIGDSAPPYVELEPVSVLPGRAIICKTRNGWSMHNFNGNLISYFPSGHLGNWGWSEPFYHKGHLYVAQMCKGAWYYRMDVLAGKLVYVGENLPR